MKQEDTSCLNLRFMHRSSKPLSSEVNYNQRSKQAGKQATSNCEKQSQNAKSKATQYIFYNFFECL